MAAPTDDPGDPRPGVLGWWDRLVGPGATHGENALVLLAGAGFTLALLGWVRIAGLDLTLIQSVLLAVLALDVAGGIVANATVAGSRWWHRPTQTWRDHLGFVAAHLHPFALAWAFPAVAWSEAALVYGWLLVGAIAILGVPRRLSRPVALATFATGLLLAEYAVSMPVALRWFVPLLYLKLLVGHLVGPDTRAG